jgi:hypothetical protein
MVSSFGLDLLRRPSYPRLDMLGRILAVIPVSNGSAMLIHIEMRGKGETREIKELTYRH